MENFAKKAVEDHYEKLKVTDYNLTVTTSENHKVSSLKECPLILTDTEAKGLSSIHIQAFSSVPNASINTSAETTDRTDDGNQLAGYDS